MNFDLYKRIHSEFNDVIFYEDSHEYFSSGVKGISVTGLKSKFVSKFESEYWALYKTIEREFGKDRVWSHAKRAVKEFHIAIDSVHNHYKDLLSFYDIAPILAEWKEKSDVSLSAGSRIHKYLEIGKSGKFESSRIEACDKFLHDKSHYVSVKLEGICASPCRRVMGQYDGLFWDPQDDILELADYKTDEEISFVNDYGNKMLGPLSHFDECNGSEYIVQLNLYRIFLEQIEGLEIGRMRIYNVREKEGMYIPYDIPKVDLPFEEMLSYDHSARNIFSTRGAKAAY